MRQKLLLLVALLVAIPLGLRADDVFKDVTSTYLTNADFEGTYSAKSGTGVSSDRAIYEPNGWTVIYTNSWTNDCSALDSDSKQWNFFKDYNKPSAGGDKSYWIRFQSSRSNQQLELSQTITLPLGTYKVSADYFKALSGGDGYLFVNNTTQNGTSNETWIQVNITFTSDGTTTTKLGYRAVHTNTYNKIYAFDNVVLQWNLTVSLQSLLDAANTFYTAEGTTYTALKTAIDNAEANKTSDNASTLETYYNALAAALDLAKNHRKPWLTAWTTANTNYASATYANVTGTEKTALKTEIDKSEPSTADDYDSAKTALESANTTFTGAKASYDAFITAKNAEIPDLAYATSAKKAAVTTAKGASAATSASDADEKTAAIATALRAYYESHAAAENVATASDQTSRITDAEDPSNTNAWTKKILQVILTCEQ